MILADPRNPRALARLARIEDRLPPLPEDLVLVLGGDGHMLSCMHEHGVRYTYLGVNCGRVGFLLNDADDEALIAALASRSWKIREVNRLKLEGRTVDGKKVMDRALNDIYLERMSGQTAHLHVRVDGETVVERLVCDGVIVSTALGSTAYALAAGGAACHLGLSLVQLTPIAPHSPRLPSIVLSSDCVIDVTVRHPEKRPVRAVSDGRDHVSVAEVSIRKTRGKVKLAFLQGHHPTHALVRKLIRS
ncbi:MAG: NAD(+) kinase [Proteobacteria bacterium]|nr:NAD(+) kinase [Pseudomonadota bacterium]MCP4922381.1 NAD(+) kinase [Pseudomonadota bacterium]